MTKPPIKIITTEDGSHSLLRTDINETYHSFRGAVGESLHVFIQEGLGYWFAENESNSCKVFEVGFGTGLNGLLATSFAHEKEKNIEYHALEPFPVPEVIYTQLNYGNGAQEHETLQKLHQAPWGENIELSEAFSLRKYKLKLEDFQLNSGFDVVFFDAFAPSKQSEIWNLQNLESCYKMMNIGGVLTTYCAQGQFKRDLKTAGFEVETLQGAMGKKEMVRAVKRGSLF